MKTVPVGLGVVRAIIGDPADPSGDWRDAASGCTYRFTTFSDRPELREGWEARLLNSRPAEEWAPIVEGSRIALTMPACAPRAVLLYLPGMAGSRPKALIDWARGANLAFVEVRTSAMDTPSEPVRIRWTADVPDAAKGIAQDVDERLAQTAYDAEGALAFFEIDHPELRKLPVVIVGASAGALASPAVTLRLGERVAAVVLIGGGCDIFLISQRSNLAKKLLPVQWGERTSNVDVDRADAAYRAATCLDPLKLAPQLKAVPVLNVFATVDSFVPTPAARELQECLGNPDRLTFLGGHMAMFLSLRGDSSAVARWIEDKIAGRGNPGK